MSAPTSAAQPPLSRRASIAAGLAFIAAGMYPLAIGLGFAAARPGSVHAPLWVVAIAGACFVFIGAAFAVPRGDVRLRGFLLGLVVTGLALVFDWVAFGPGERHFSGGVSFAGTALRAGSGETSGRIAFGIAAVVLDAFAAWGWYRWLQALANGPRKASQSGME